MVTKIIVSIVALVFSILFIVRGCTNSSTEAIEAASKAGFSEIQVLDHHYILVGFQGCSKEDASKFDMIGRNSQGARINFSVCQGWVLKNATLRF